jgi:hypothetical protein
MFYSFFWVISQHLYFLCQCLGTLGSVFIGHLNRETNWEEMVGVFIQVKVWLKRSLGQSEGWWDGVGGRHDLVEDQSMDGNSPNLRPELEQGYWVEMAPGQSKEGEP